MLIFGGSDCVEGAQRVEVAIAFVIECRMDEAQAWLLVLSALALGWLVHGLEEVVGPLQALEMAAPHGSPYREAWNEAVAKRRKARVKRANDKFQQPIKAHTKKLLSRIPTKARVGKRRRRVLWMWHNASGDTAHTTTPPARMRATASCWRTSAPRLKC